MFKVNLLDKVIAITGAGGIICSEFAKALAKEGAKVALLDINYDAAKQVADEIGENAMFVAFTVLQVGFNIFILTVKIDESIKSAKAFIAFAATF